MGELFAVDDQPLRVDGRSSRADERKLLLLHFLKKLENRDGVWSEVEDVLLFVMAE